MLDYTPKAIIEWMHRSLGVNGQPNVYEVRTECPWCSYENFFFNVKKQIGICHKASCGKTPNLEMLIEHVGFAPEEFGYTEDIEEPSAVTVTLPGYEILSMQGGELMTTSVPALEYLRKRGLTDEIILNWSLTFDGQRIYVPIYHKGELVSYNSRDLTGTAKKKYLIAAGTKTSKFILGWEECRLWHRLALVENTFVSLWLRRELWCTTVFGSHLSDEQVDMIAKSNVKQVAILWDQHTELSSAKACAKLHKLGISASYWRITGQPDDYDKATTVDRARCVYDAAAAGIPYVDYREI